MLQTWNILHGFYCGITFLWFVSRGEAVKMSFPLYKCPSLRDVLPNLLFLQNLPSVVVGHVLNPQPGDIVLDMCASPGAYIWTLDLFLFSSIDSVKWLIKIYLPEEDYSLCVAYTGFKLGFQLGLHACRTVVWHLGVQLQELMCLILLYLLVSKMIFITISI